MVSQPHSSTPIPEDRMPLLSRFAFVLLYIAGAVGGLWQYADPRVTMGVLGGALLAFAVSFLPARGAWPILRWCLQIAVISLALWWMALRLKSAAIDLALVEAAALLGLALLMEPPESGYNVLSLVALILVAYGGFVPLRHLYLPVAVVFLFTGVWLLYRTRAAGLAGQRAHTANHLRAYGQEWGFRTVHFILFVLVWTIVFALFPPGRHGTLGLFPVSVATGQVMRYPKLWKEWWQTPWVREEPEGTRLIEGKTKVSVIRRDAKTKVDATSPDKAETNVLGSGSGTVGQELVLRVKCDEKLYWLVRTYDEYDGHKWHASSLLNRSNSSYLPPTTTATRLVEQNFSVEKASSSWLPAAYEADRITWDVAGRPGPPQQGFGEAGYPVHIGQSGVAMVVASLPPLPWRYHCRSRLPLFSADQSSPLKELTRPLQRFLALPRQKVSVRVRELATQLTASGTTPFAKAVALREHLRHNYQYTLTAVQAPEKADPVDFFLFESKSGTCVHFAQALTVLARLAGLPARVATGYSPGNYNVVTGMFEVYEYHAHAWSQILIAPYGWLTFDGVAPGNLQLQAVPPVIGKLRDPFGDEWEARVPEMAKPELAAAAAKELAAELEQESPPRVVAAVQKAKESIVAKAQRDSRSFDPDTRSLARAAGVLTWEWIRNLFREVRTGWRSWLSALSQRLVRIWKLWTIALFRVSNNFFAALAVAGALFLITCFLYRPVARCWRNWRQRYRCDRLWAGLEKTRPEDAVVMVRLGYAFSAELLTLRGFRRQGNQDLLEYGDWVARREALAGNDVQAVFAAFVKVQFSPVAVTAADAQAVKVAAGSLRRHWRNTRALADAASEGK